MDYGVSVTGFTYRLRGDHEEFICVEDENELRWKQWGDNVKNIPSFARAISYLWMDDWKHQTTGGKYPEGDAGVYIAVFPNSSYQLTTWIAVPG